MSFTRFREEREPYRVILEMLTNAWQVERDIDPHRTENIRGPDAAMHQHVRASDGATREDNLLPDLNRRTRSTFDESILNAGCGQVIDIRGVEQNTSDGGIYQDMKIVSWGQRVDVRVAGFRPGPVRGIDGRCRNERPKRLSTSWISTPWNPGIL